MATNRRTYSDLAVPPGEYLAEVLDAKGMSQVELARRTGRPIQAINEIIMGAHIWTGLESRYRLIKAREEEKELIQKELPYLQNTPYRQLAELGYVKRARDGEHKIRELHRFYGVSSLVNLPEDVGLCEAVVPPQREVGRFERRPGGLAQVRRVARRRGASRRTFDQSRTEGGPGGEQGLDEAEPRGLPSLTLARRLAACGVVLVLLPHFSKTYAHGATFWLNVDKAVLVMSIRGKWADIFWFSLFHEIGHSVAPQEDDVRRRRDDSPPNVKHLEEEADEFAANLLIPADGLREIRQQRATSVRPP